jgi:hypothetical protein
MPALRQLVPLLLLLAVTPAAHAAIVIDGQLDGDYGAPIVVQTVQTDLVSGGLIPGDNTLADLNFASGSELDAAYAIVSDGVLHLFLAGNLALRLTMQQNDTHGHILDVFVDCAPGGENMLSGLGTGNPLNGMTFDAGFAADYWFELRGEGNQFAIDWRAGEGVIDGSGSGTFTDLGFGMAGGPGTLAGGTNPNGVQVTIDNRNIAGVTLGCNGSSGAGVTRGIEWAIPLAAIGSPAGCFRMTAIVRDGNAAMSPISNSVLAPVPVGTCPLGAAQFVDFATIPGDQTFQVCTGPLDVPAQVPGLALAFAGPNPARGDRVAFRFTLPDGGAGTLELFDVSGRIVRRATVTGASGTVELARGRTLAPGLYWARLTHAGARVVRRICLAE